MFFFSLIFGGKQWQINANLLRFQAKHFSSGLGNFDENELNEKSEQNPNEFT